METRNIAVVHQILSICDIDFQRKSIYGYTELTITPLADEVRVINLNCKQCKIFSILFNGRHEAEFEYYDPTQRISPEDDDRRDLQSFLTQQELALLSVDADEGNGELTIHIPIECQSILKERKSLKVAIEFLLENPNGGLLFTIPPNLNETPDDCLLYTSSHNACVWFPCVQSTNELCTWKIEVTVHKDYQVIASGDQIERLSNEDPNKVTYHYYLSIPTCAPNIGLVVGVFDSVNDENMHEISSYCNPKLIPLIKNTTSFVHEVFEFYEDYLSTTYPYSSYKQVFVHNAYEDMTSYASMTIFNVKLLHSNTIIDQTFETRKLIATAVARQFFSCFLNYQTYSDWWIVAGISSYLSGLYYKKAFGNNEYKHRIYSDLKEICKYEKEHGYICLDFKIEGKEMNFSSIASMSSSSGTSSSGSSKYNYSIRHPWMLCSSLKRIADKKSYLVLRLIEDNIGNDVLLQVLNKLLVAATQASNHSHEQQQWSNLVVSTESFVKQVTSISSKDLKPVIDQWIHRGGFIRFNIVFTYNRKRNCLEIEIKQDNLVQQKSTFSRYKYVGPLTVTVQELDGSFTHTVQLEESQTRYEIALHSKGKRSKKKKIPLSNGEEIDIDLTQVSDADSPILWCRVDPDMKLIREIDIKQEGYQWQMQLKYERDICAQLDSIAQLKKFQAKEIRDLLTSVVENNELYYQVRVQSALLLAEISNGQLQLLQTFKKCFMFSNSQKLVKQNNFSNLQSYFMQKNLPVALGKLRNMHNVCPNDVITFLIDLIHYNENGKNRFSDCYYKAALIDALNETVTSTAVASASLDYVKSLNSNAELRSVVEEVVLRLNLEKLSPTYHYVVTCSCLRALRNLQRLGHLPENLSLFKQYAQYGTFEEVRKVAFEIMIRFFEVRPDQDLMNYLLDFIENDPSMLMRHYILQLLCKYPPFRPNTEITNLNSQSLVERIWALMNDRPFDIRMRCDLAELYHTLYGLGKPKPIYIAAQEKIVFNDAFEPIKL